MVILCLRITMRASWVHSLKEKRGIIKSIIQKLKNKFNISVGEIGKQDVHNTIVIGIAGICADAAQSDSTMENIITFIENNSDAEIINIEKDDIRR